MDQDDEFLVSFHKEGTFGFADKANSGLDSETKIPINEWCHICCVWNIQTKDYRLHINGNPVPKLFKGGAPLSITGEPIRIGTDGLRNRCFTGVIDELRIWNVARSQEEISANKGRKLKGDEKGLIGYWDFDEGKGQVIHDLSKNGNKGRLGHLPVEDKQDPKWVASGIYLYSSY